MIAGINLLKEHGVEFNVLSVIDDKNAVDIKETYEFFKKNGFGYLQFIPYVDEAMGVSLSEKSYLEFLKQSFDLWYDDIQKGEYVSVRNFDNYVSILMGRAPENCAMSGYCANYFVVEAGGDIYPCDFYCKKGDKISSVFDEKPFELNAKTKAFFDESLIIHSCCKPCKYYSLCRGGCKRDRVENFSRNKYCKAYFEFFDYSLKRMVKIARRLS